METRNERTKQCGRAAVAAAVVALSAAALSACGGGGKDGLQAAGASANSAGGAASIKVEGQSMALSSELTTVSIVTPPVTWKADGSFPQGPFRLSGRGYPVSTLKAHAPGAYTTMPWGTEALSLSRGSVTDMAGNGQFAIGRWTDGSDSAGHSYNANQGQVWAVGAPVNVAVPWTGFTCTLVAATRPTSSDGNTLPGVLKSATATVAGARDARGVVQNTVSLTMQYSIGSDLNQAFADRVPLGMIAASRLSRSSLSTTFLGPDASKPYLVVSYGAHAPTAGLINGLAVLSCS